MTFETEEKRFVRYLNDDRLYSTAVLAHLFPGGDPDPFAAKCRFLDKLNVLVLIQNRLPDPDGVNRLSKSSLPAWFGWRWKQLIGDQPESEPEAPTHPSTQEPNSNTFRFLPEEEAYVRTLDKDRLYSPTQIARGFGDPYLKHQAAYYGGTRESHRDWLYRKLSFYASRTLANPHGVITLGNGHQLAWTGQRWIELIEAVNWP